MNERITPLVITAVAAALVYSDGALAQQQGHQVSAQAIQHAASQSQHGTPPPLNHLLSLRKGDGIGGNGHNAKGIGGLRTRAIRQEAKRIASQTALRWRNQQIQSILKRYGGQLDDKFNFAPLMLDHGMVVPPVINKVKNSTRQYSNKTMRTVKVGYRLAHPARIVTTAPTWRSFLITHYAKPQSVPNALLPKNNKETQLWKKAVRRGWKNGIQQADRNFRIDLNLLTATYLGMLRYHRLHAEHMVSAPNLATTNLRITSHGKKLNVGDRIDRLTRSSHFTSHRSWHAVVVPAHPRKGQHGPTNGGTHE